MIRSALDFWHAQFASIFLGAGSTISIPALAITLFVAFCCLRTNRRQGRSIKARVAARALFPRRLWRSRSGRADIGWFAFSILGGGISFGWLLISSQWIAARVDAATQGISLIAMPQAVAILFVTIMNFLAYEFAYWFDHMLMHRVRWLWMIHRVHHSAESLSLLTNFRVHPLESILYHNIVAIVVGITQGFTPVLLGHHAQPAEIGGLNVLVMCAAVFLTHLQHSHFWITLGPKWGKILLGPAHHQLHHSGNPAHYDCNFGSSLAIFDRIYGSFLMPHSNRQPLEFGIGPQNFNPQGLFEQTVMPFADAASAIGEGMRPSAPTEA